MSTSNTNSKETLESKRKHAASVIELVSSVLVATPGARLQTTTDKLIVAQEILKKSFQIDFNDFFVLSNISDSSGFVSLARVNFPTEVSRHMVRTISNLLREADLGEELRYDPDDIAKTFVSALNITRSGASFKVNFEKAVQAV